MQTTLEKKSKNPFKKIPWYGWVGAIIFIVFQIGLYKLGGLISERFIAPLWSVHPLTKIDDFIPYCPYFFIQIYFLAYAFWFIGPLVISTGKKENFINFMIYGTIASLVGFLWFIFMPTWMNRETEGLLNLADDIKTPFTRFLMKAIIEMDTGKMAWNLCPSYHCMASALCAFGVLKIKEHHVGTQVGFSIFAILVFASTVLVKQHYFVDILGGVAVATIPFLIVRFWWKPGERIMIKNPLFLNTKITKKDVEEAKEAKDIKPEEVKEIIEEKK